MFFLITSFKLIKSHFALVSFLIFMLASIHCSSPDDANDQLEDTNSGDFYTTVTRITPGGIRGGDFFGFDIAVTNEFTVVSSPFNSEKGQRTGAVYIFKRSGLDFENTVEILYIDNTTIEDRFGWTVAIDNTILVVGAPQNDKYGENAGLAFVYQNTGANQWDLIKELKAPNPQSNQKFGNVVAIDQGTIVVSSEFDDDNYYDEGDITDAGGIAQGSVFVYDEVNNWEFSQKLVPNVEQGHLWDAFGSSLDMNGNYLAIGAKGTDNTTYKAPGSVYMFKQSGGIWSQTIRIEASDGESEDFFGAKIALDGNDLAITAPGRFNSLMPNPSQVFGSAYVFSKLGDDWIEDAKLFAEDAKPEDSFGGGDIALHNNYLIVGAPLTEVATKFNGAAYFFKRESGWVESHRIVAPDPLNEDLFGGSLATTEDLIFVGAHRRCNETGCLAGALYFVN